MHTALSPAPESATAQPAAEPGRALPAFAAALLAFMVLVILWGAIVRATGSGAGCGDNWPRCNGTWVPQHPHLTTLIEFTHRSMSGILTALVAALIAWTFVARPRGDRARRAVVWCGILLISEALLGAVLVLGGYVRGNTSDMRVVVQCVHFTNTMLLLAALTLSWWWLRPRAPLAPGLLQSTARPVALLALLATILTGATGSVAALADTLFPSVSLRTALLSDFASGSPLLVRMRWVHPAAAVAAIALSVWLALRLGSTAGRWVLALAGLQVLLGVADVLLLAPISLQILHLLGADLFWIALVAAASAIVFPARRVVAGPVP